MKELTLIDDTYKVLSSEGVVLLEAPIMEIYYEIGFALNELPNCSKKDKFIHVAAKLNEIYGSNLGWAQSLDILNQLDEILEKSKKKPTSTPELPIGTE